MTRRGKINIKVSLDDNTPIYKGSVNSINECKDIFKILKKKIGGLD